MSTDLLALVMQMLGGISLAFVILLTTGAIVRKLEQMSKNPACYILGHSIRVGSETTRVFVDKWDYLNKRYVRKELLWTCTRKGCSKRFRTTP